MLPATADTSQINVILERITTIQDDVTEIKADVKDIKKLEPRVVGLETTVAANCKEIDRLRDTSEKWSLANTAGNIIAGVLAVIGIGKP